MATYPDLADKVAFVTGGASGIGAAIVEAFVAQRSRVGFVDVDREAGESLAEQYRQAGHEVAFACCDLRDIDALKRAFTSLSESLGPANVLVNNAARDDRHDWHTVTPDYYDERMATNLRHQFFAVQAVAPGMIDAGGGSVINLGSVSWMEKHDGLPLYATAKAAIHGLTRSLARELGRHRIRVNTVVPGWIMTERQKSLWLTPETLEKQLERQCLPIPIEPVYVANMVVFLASDDAAMCTANHYLVDGGSS